jgi:D-beta-D-heptose 7-phosphate kinase/D-beta-D-heptose 1-phosphate adenosyltransferase
MNLSPPNAPEPATPDSAQAVARLAHGSVLVVGDAMLDRYIHGTVSRMSPEAPSVPVLAEERELALPGGAANVVRYLTALGAAVAFISVVGDDPAGSDLTGLVGGQPNVEPWLLVEGGRTTTVKTRYLSNGRHLLRADREQVTPIPERLAERVLRIARDAMAATSLTVLSDYGKGVLADGMAARLIAAAHESGRPVIAAPPRGISDQDLAAYAGADGLVLCRTDPDAAGPGGDSAAGESGVARAAALRAASGAGTLLLVEPAGLALATAGGAWSFATAATRMSGGMLADPLVAMLAAAMAVRLDPSVTLQLAGLATVIVAAKGGTAVVRPDDLLAALAMPDAPPVASVAPA